MAEHVCPVCSANVAAGVAFCPECGTRLTPSGNLITSSPPPAALRVLQQRYELTKKLGQGGMGSVYLARDRRLSTVSWAVKELSDAAITGPLERQQAQETFRQEAELLARLSHPNLPRVTDHFEEDGKNYLVMELVPGESLAALLQREPPPRPLSQVLEWARQIGEVLDYLHRQDPPIIFRDLKPSNVMVTPNGTLKLVDFGIARVFKPGQARDTQAYGTMGYSAPEQYGRGQTDQRSDVYSLGVLLHFLLTGHDPAATPFRLPPANQLNPQVPAPIAAAIAKATDNAPEQRFADVREFYVVLRDHAAVPASGRISTAPTPLPIPMIGPTIPQSGGLPGSQPLASGPLPLSTSLADTARLLGVGGALLMLVGGIIMIIGVIPDPDSILFGVGVLLVLPAFFFGPTGAALGLFALIRQETSQSQEGRRRAAFGMAGGVATLVLCCVVAMISGQLDPSDSSSSRTNRAQSAIAVVSSRGEPEWPVPSGARLPH